MRKLDPDEAALWARVAATIRPLSRAPLKTAAFDARPSDHGSVPPAPVRAPQGRVPPPRTPAPKPPSSQTLQGATLDGSWDKKLRGGDIQPDRILDLHGHTLDRAWQAIDDALERSVNAGDRVLLLITGHARSGEPPIERGRIRAAVNDWLGASRHSRSIAAVRAAHRRHGGGGSLYIILRRR